MRISFGRAAHASWVSDSPTEVPFLLNNADDLPGIMIVSRATDLYVQYNTTAEFSSYEASRPCTTLARSLKLISQVKKRYYTLISSAMEIVFI